MFVVWWIMLFDGRLAGARLGVGWRRVVLWAGLVAVL